jgi:hypothetical protein
MRAKTSEDPANLLQWLYERGEETVGQVLHEVLGRREVADGLTKMVQRAAKTKGRVDKNVETVLHLMNLPSRADYHKLLVKIEHLQGSLVNLNMKLDRLMAAQDRPPRKKKIEPEGVS